jgi:DNA invertase Pin-like site-specific DNA recombinase
MNAHRIAVYYRVSTNAQDVAMQRHAVGEWLAKYPGAQVVEFCDEAMSGKRDDRPGYRALLESVEHGDVDTVVVYRLDRLSRNALGFLKVLIDWLQRDVSFVSVTQPILHLTEDNPFRLTFLAMMAEVGALERDVIVTRVRSGIAAARARGVKFGRPPQHSDLRGQIRTMVAGGRSYREVAAALGVSASTVHRSMKA